MSKQFCQEAGEILWKTRWATLSNESSAPDTEGVEARREVLKLCEQFDAEKATMSKQFWQKAGEILWKTRWATLSHDSSAPGTEGVEARRVSAQVMRAVWCGEGYHE